MDLLGFFLPNCGGNLTLYADLFHGGKMLMSDVGLCCHVDEEHAVKAKNGVCPVCAKRVGMDLVGHITKQHGSFLKRKRRFQKIGSNLTLSILRKELHEGNLQSLLGGSQHLVSSSNTKPEPLLSSFMCNLPVVEPELVSTQPYSIEEAGLTKESSSEDSSHRNTILCDRNIHQSPLSDMEQEVRARRCEFVKGLLLSTFLDDN